MSWLQHARRCFALTDSSRSDSNNATYVFKTEYRAEIFYPSYYDEPRPQPTGIPSTISYGGAPFDVNLPVASRNGAALGDIKIALMRTGFQTHAMA